MGSTCACTCDNDGGKKSKKNKKTNNMESADIEANQNKQRVMQRKYNIEITNDQKEGNETSSSSPSELMIDSNDDEAVTNTDSLPLINAGSMNSEISEIFGDEATIQCVMVYHDSMGTIPNNDELSRPFDITFQSKQDDTPQIRVSAINNHNDRQQLLQKKPSTEMSLNCIQNTNLSDIQRTLVEEYEISGDESSDASFDSDTEISENERLIKMAQTSNKRKSWLIRDQSRDLWESEDIDELEDELKTEQERLSRSTLITPTSLSSNYNKDSDINTDNYSDDTDDDDDDVEQCKKPNLFRPISSDKWDDDDIITQKNEMAKQMLHLTASNRGKNLGIDHIQ